MNIYEMICIFLCGRLWAYREYKVYLSVDMRKSHILTAFIILKMEMDELK